MIQRVVRKCFEAGLRAVLIDRSGRPADSSELVRVDTLADLPDLLRRAG